MDLLQGAASGEDVQAWLDKLTASGNPEVFEFSLDEQFLQWLATRNPVATTLFYEQFTDAVFTARIGVPPVNKWRKSVKLEERPRGVLGTGLAESYVEETDGRKPFHRHASVHGGAVPALLATKPSCPWTSMRWMPRAAL